MTLAKDFAHYRIVGRLASTARALMSAPVSVDGDALRPGRPREVASGGFLVRGFGWAFGVGNYDVLPAGETFVFVRPEEHHDLDTDHAVLVLGFDPSRPLVAQR